MILNISKLSTQIFKKISILSFLLLFFLTSHGENKKGTIFGKVISSEKEIIEYATVHLKGTSFGAVTNDKGIYELSAPAGKYTLVVSVLGFNTVEKDILLNQGARIKENITIDPQSEQLEEVLVVANGVSRLNRSAYNAIAIDAKALQNSTSSLSEALAQAPGMKIRESGGVGSDMQLTMDGFNGKHIKVFIDGVPQEGVGSSFSLNNIPVNYAERIEIYKGVVPVGFGTDAIGGVINIITKKNHNRWFLDASYSYGSFNTHRSNINFGQTFSNMARDSSPNWVAKIINVRYISFLRGTEEAAQAVSTSVINYINAPFILLDLLLHFLIFGIENWKNVFDSHPLESESESTP